MSPLKLIRRNGSAVEQQWDEESPLELSGLTVTYKDKPAIFSVDLKISSNKLVAIVGPNGAGKSTLIRASLGIVPRVSGSVKIYGKEFKENRHRIAYVPQRASVDWDFPANVIDIVMMGYYKKVGFFDFMGTKHRKLAMECLERVSMQDFAGRQIGQLSGGQQQRVFLARALAQNADLYFLDEPFAGVDAATEKAIISVLNEIKDNGCTVLCVHHDLSTVKNYFEEVVFINVRKIAHGPVQTTFTEENLQATYCGRLASNQINDLQLSNG